MAGWDASGMVESVGGGGWSVSGPWWWR